MPQFFENFKISSLKTTFKKYYYGTPIIKEALGAHMQPDGYTYRTPSRDGALHASSHATSPYRLPHACSFPCMKIYFPKQRYLFNCGQPSDTYILVDILRNDFETTLRYKCGHTPISKCGPPFDIIVDVLR